MQFNAIICNFNQEMIKLLSHVRVKQATSRFSLYISSQRVSNGLRETPNSGEEAIRSNCCFKSSALIVNGKYLHFIEGSQLIQSLYAIPYLKALGLPVHICTFLQSNRFLLVKWCRNLDISNRTVGAPTRQIYRQLHRDLTSHQIIFSAIADISNDDFHCCRFYFY